MGILNSTKPKLKCPTEADKAILELKIQRDKLKQLKKKSEQIVQKELEIATIHLKNNEKKKALLTLKKKKTQLEQIEKIENELFLLDELTNKIENSVFEKQLLEGLSRGTKVLQLLNKEMDLDKVQQLMFDTADAIEYQKQIEEELGSVVYSKQEEDDLLSELELSKLDQVNVPTGNISADSAPVDRQEADVQSKKETKPVLLEA